jgi:hypothetical protein
MTKKTTSLLLFIALFVAIFLFNFSNLMVPFDISTVIRVIVVSLIEFVVIYLIIILIRRIVNCYSRQS